MKALESQINLTLLDDIISFVVSTSEADLTQKHQLAQRCMFPVKAADASLFQERYGFLYLGELLERYEEQFGMSAPDLRAIALALGYTRDIATKEMFVGSQRADFIRTVERAAKGDVYLTGALYLLNEGEADGPAYGKQLAEWQYAKTEELVFAMSLFDDAEQLISRFKDQLVLLLGPNRTLPVLENTKIFGWLAAKLSPLKKLLKAREFAAIRALLALPVSFVKPGSKPYDCLTSYGYQPLEIAYANMTAVCDRWLDKGLNPFGLAAEKIAVNLFRTVLAQEDPLPKAMYVWLTQIYAKYAKFEIKYHETHKLADALGEDIRIKNAETMAWFIGRESLLHPAVGSFDVLDAKWDTLPAALEPDQYLRLFENSLSGEMGAEELERRIKHYDTLTGLNYLDRYRKSRDGHCFPLLVDSGVIDLWAEFQSSLPDRETASPSMLYYIGCYVDGIKTAQAFHFLRKFMPQYGYAGLKGHFSGFYNNFFSNGFDRQLWEEHTYSGGNITLTLKRDFLEDDPAGRLLLLHWADEYFFTVKPAYYLVFIQALLGDDYASGLLPREELRKLLDLLLTQSKLPVRSVDHLKQRYFTAEEWQADQEARDAEQLAAKRRERDAEVMAMREEYAGMANGSFQSVWEFTELYQYRSAKVAIAAQIAREGLDAQLQAAGNALAKMDAVYFLHVCARLIQRGAMGWAEAQACISKIKEASDDAPGDDTDG